MIRFSHLLIIFLIITATHLLFYQFGLYGHAHWLDIPMHFFGGVFLALVWLWIVQRRGEGAVAAQQSFLFFFMAIIGFVLVFGTAWEIAEYLAWVYFSDVCHICSLYDPIVADLLTDLVVDCGGALAVAFLCYKR